MSKENIDKSGEEYLTQILRQIKQTQKQINRKVSLILKKVEEFIFKSPYKLSEDQQSSFLVGNEDSDNKGFLYLCGLKHRIKNSLKKSAFTAMKLLLKILKESRQKEGFQKLFCDLDDEDFKLLKLSNHLLVDKNNDFSAHKVAMLIRERRPHLSVSVYILGKKSQKEFEDWYKEEQNKKNKEWSQTTEWKEEEADQLNKKKHRHESIEPLETRKFKHKSRNNFQLIEFERTQDYYLRTFQDPLKSFSENQIPVNDENQPIQRNRNSVHKKSKIKQLFQSKPNKIDLPSNLEEIIDKIHIDSNSFDPFILITSLYQNESPSFFSNVIQRLQSQQNEALSLNRSLIYYNLSDYIMVEKNINSIVMDLVKKEARKDSGASLELRSSLGALELGLSSFAEPLLKSRIRGDQIRTVLSLFHKYQFLIEAPNKMKQSLLAKDLRNLMRIYTKINSYLKNFSILPVFSRISEEISAIIKDFKEKSMEFASLKPKKFEKIHEVIQALFSLSITENPIEYLLEQLMNKLVWRLEKVFHIDIFEEKVMKTPQNPKMRMSEVNEENNDEGDLLDRLVGELEGIEVRKYNLRQSEKLNGEILIQLENFMILSKEYGDGVFDFRFKEMKINMDDILEQREHSINSLINGFFEKFIGFTKELLNRMSSLLVPQEHSKKRFKMLKTDLRIMARKVSDFENMLVKYGISLEELKKIKLEMIINYIQAITGNLIELVIPDIRIENNYFLKIDFFGRQYSEFLQIVFEKILNEFKELANFPGFIGLNQSNINIVIDKIKIIIRELIVIIRKRLQKINEDKIILIILTNIRFIQNYLIHDIIEELYNMYEIGEDINRSLIKDILIKAIKEIIEANVLELKKMYTEFKILPIYCDILSNILIEPERTDKNFLLGIFNNDLSKIEKYIAEKKDSLRNYEIFVASEEEPQLRVYLIDILTRLAIFYGEIKLNAGNYLEEIMKNLILFITALFIRPVKALNNLNIVRIKQIWIEIEFFQLMTSKFQTQTSLKNCWEISMHLKRLSTGNPEITASLKDLELFNDDEKSTKKKLLRNSRYKLQHNLHCLISKEL